VKTTLRLERIVSLIEEHGFLSVGELSHHCEVSEMTVRRDLEKLDDQKRIHRTYGGAVPFHNGESAALDVDPSHLDQKMEVLLVDQVDVLIATSVNPYYDSLLIDRAVKKKIPIIAESIEMPSQCTIVALDNYQAGVDLGMQAGHFLIQHGVNKACLLDLTFHQPNT
jgi:hypothetical protein